MEQIEQDNKKQVNKEVTQPPQPEPKWQFNTAWILVPLAMLGMAYVLTNARSSITWEKVMDSLGVTTNRAAYSRMFHLCLVLTFIVVAARILGRKDK